MLGTWVPCPSEEGEGRRGDVGSEDKSGVGVRRKVATRVRRPRAAVMLEFFASLVQSLKVSKNIGIFALCAVRF